MPFGTAYVVTNIGKAMFADRMRTSPGTYTSSPKYIAMGVGATGAGRTAAVTDTALTTEVETRTIGVESTVTTSVTNDTYQNVGTITASGSRNVDEAMLNDASSSGNMFLSATFPVIALTVGQAVQFTAKVQLN